MAIGQYLGAGSGVTKILYHLDGNSTDSSGNGYSGNPTNITWVGGRLGSGSASFNGTSSKITSNTTVNLLGTSNNFTFSAWINPGVTQVTYSEIFDYDHGNTTSSNRCFAIQQNSTTTNNYALHFWDGSTYITGGASFQLTANIWQLLTCVKNGTTITHYINGIQQSTGTVSLNINKPTTYFQFGDIIAGGERRWFNGIQDEVIIENKAWTIQEIKKYYSYSRGLYGIL